MLRCFLRGKIHRLKVTGCDLDYHGSLTVDSSLISAASLAPYEKVDIYNITNGARFSTYLIEGAANSGEVCVNGAAARLAQPGDLLIVVGFQFVAASEVDAIAPVVVLVDSNNRIIRDE